MGDIAQVEESFKRISSHKGIIGTLVINGDGIVIRSTLETVVSVHYAALVSHFVIKARGVVKQLEQEDELQFMRIRSKKHEIMISPDFDKHKDYYLVVIQDPSTK
eukprot:TRINITY_DN26177_c2_g1_i1.p4 TRINITY_DN26177_c2_g1~~TRINITY_DN26177_c2_g1_i1.p4  ORF type:complete len:105 (-),score=6.33 TRINITY_DN26177_c2_g1_i1:365-679(-)